MTEIPETPRVEGLIAIAGPAVNFVLVALFAPLWFLLWSFDVGAHGLVGIFVLVNLALGCFNMVPAFPMDGGRLLRAFLARRGTTCGPPSAPCAPAAGSPRACSWSRSCPCSPPPRSWPCRSSPPSSTSPAVAS